MAKRPRVFLSYDHRDEDWVREFHDELEKQGVDAWMDRDHLDADLRGKDLGHAVYDAIESADLVVSVVSDDDRQAEWLRGWTGDWVEHEKWAANGRVFAVAHGGQTAEEQLQGRIKPSRKGGRPTAMSGEYVGNEGGAEAARRLANEIRELSAREDAPPRGLSEAIARAFGWDRIPQRELYRDGPVVPRYLPRPLRRLLGQSDDDE